MPRNTHSLPRLVALAAALALLLGTQVVLAPGASAAGYVPISGSGSTWSSNALDQWRRNVNNNYGITVNFSANGSTSGRNDFKAETVDFAVSEIEYGLTDGGVPDPKPTRAFGYMPIVAGGTSFMYNLKIGNKKVTNLRLSGDTITKIFTQQITNWSDPAIKADNPSLTLPAIKIVPVVRSDGSGTTAQFTRYMAALYAPQWDAYCQRAGRTITPCGFTSFYPLASGMEAKAGSQGVAGFVAQDSSAGSITYVEYSYARNSGFPVAKVLNAANYYVEPKAPSVAVALLKAQIRGDLTSDLSQVYTNPDPRTYPLSSYSYMIVPQDLGRTFNTEKGRTLSDFAYYFLCEGQQQADQLGYSPLPLNLVQAGVDQVAKIPGTTNKLNRNALAKCNNPTFSPDGTNLLAKNAPQPDKCDQKGAGAQCANGTGGAQTPTQPSGSRNGGTTGGGTGGNGTTGNGPGGGNTGGGGAGGGGPGATTGPGATGTLASGSTSTATAAARIDPDTGLPVGAGTGSGDGSTVSAIPVSVSQADDTQRMLLATIAVVLLMALILGPPLMARRMRDREGPRP